MGKKTESKIETALKAVFPDSNIAISSENNDGMHFELEIADNAFVGRSLVDQHRMVNNALAELLKGEVHAISIKTKTP